MALNLISLVSSGSDVVVRLAFVVVVDRMGLTFLLASYSPRARGTPAAFVCALFGGWEGDHKLSEQLLRVYNQIISTQIFTARKYRIP